MPSLRLIAALLVLLSLCSCGAAGDKPGVKFMPGMYHSVPYDAYDPNTVTADGKTLMLPPEGTVPVGYKPFLFGPGEEEALAAGRELMNPLTATPENLARGQKVYDTFCSVCHDPAGEGSGPIIGRFPNPPNLLADRSKNMPDGQVFHILTWGQGVMPAYRLQIDQDDRWKAIFYMRKLQGLVAESEVATKEDTP